MQFEGATTERQIQYLADQLDRHDEQVRELVRMAVDEAVGRLQGSALTPEEREWVKLASVAAGQRAKLRAAIIEKTLSGLVWAAIVGVGLMALDWLRSHGLKA